MCPGEEARGALLSRMREYVSDGITLQDWNSLLTRVFRGAARAAKYVRICLIQNGDAEMLGMFCAVTRVCGRVVQGEQGGQAKGRRDHVHHHHPSRR